MVSFISGVCRCVLLYVLEILCSRKCEFNHISMQHIQLYSYPFWVLNKAPGLFLKACIFPLSIKLVSAAFPCFVIGSNSELQTDHDRDIYLSVLVSNFSTSGFTVLCFDQNNCSVVFTVWRSRCPAVLPIRILKRIWSLPAVDVDSPSPCTSLLHQKALQAFRETMKVSSV